MIPSNPPSTSANNLPVEPLAVPQPTSSVSGGSPELPPVKGSLPYSKQDYEQLPQYEKTPELDFLILGKIPGGKQNPADPPLPVNRDFEQTVMYCLIGGETEALNFLWRESGRDPAKTTVDLTQMSMDRDTVAALVKHCGDQPHLKVDLRWFGQNVGVMDDVSRLVAEGKVNRLLLCDPSADGLEQFASVAGKIGNELCIYHTPFSHNTPISVRCEQALAEAFRQSETLRTISLVQCIFGESQGKYFIEGIHQSKSITELEMINTPLPTTPDSGYGALLDGNPTLRKLVVVQSGFQPLPDIDAIVSGLMNNHALQVLNVQVSGYTQENPQKLCTLLEKNRTLTRLCFPLGLNSDEAYQAVTASLSKNTSLTTFIVIDASSSAVDFETVVNDLMSRNRALANDPSYLQKAGRGFDPSGNSGMGDPAALIAQHAFTLSSSRREFETIMAEAELSLREQERRARETNSQPSVTTTLTTDAAATNTTTTTTTTTTTPASPGSSSS